MTLARPVRFFDALRKGVLGPGLSPSEVEGCNALLDACADWPLAWTAYGFATAYHETGHTMLPIREYGSDAYLRRMYDIEGLRPEKARELGNLHPGDGITYCGRGYVQLTGRTNYERADRELGLGGFMVDHPDLAMDPKIAAKIMVRGMEEGWFTARKLSDYLPAKGPASQGDYEAARRIINGSDRKALIAGYAMKFQDALTAGEWKA